MEEQIALRPWVASIPTITQGTRQNFKPKALFKMLSNLEGRAQSYSDALEFFNGQEEILFAVILQNSHHPRNSNRTDAIKAGKYVEIETVAQAQDYVNSLIRTHLTNDLRQAEQGVMNTFASLQKSTDIKKLIEAPDVFIAAVALSRREFYQGKGDRTTFFKVIHELDPRQIPDLARKLKMVMALDFMGLKLYTDKLCDPTRVKKQTIFQLWLKCCRQTRAVTLEQMIAFAPYQEDYLRLLDKYVDETGRTTLNMADYMVYRQQKAEQKQREGKAKAAKKAAKKNF